MKTNEHFRQNMDEILHVFHHKKSVEPKADFTNDTMRRILHESKLKEFYFPFALKVAAAIMLLVVNTYTIYFFAGNKNHAPVSSSPSALVRFYQPADTSVDFAYQLIKHK
jgi:hypothetical protein